MTQEKLKRVSNILKEISDDMEKDAKDFDGQPFTGKTVAEYFGKQGAAISALSTLVQVLIEEKII